ncbi:MAG TPA: DUF3306 domain-containing protein [Burkholderiales bacterium]|jgi:Protein of unknown function (DUF3306)|nr:DUF3306 domain-containing protein [Burkholderiales bacterium]
MAEEKEAFLSRWSRMKREQPVEKKAEPETPAPALPPVESVTPESDFAGFMHPKVKDELRRLALKKLFTDPHFNVPDPFEPFSGDWTGEALAPDMLAKLNQARTLIFDEPQSKPEEKPVEEPVTKVEGETKQDEPGRQDT